MSGTTARHDPGELRRGWLLILASGVGVALGSVVLPYYSIGALVKPLTHAFGWARADVQGAILFSTGLGAVTAPVIGALIDRFGPRALALPCIVGLSAGFFLASAMNGSLWMFYVAYGAVAILGAGTTPVTWTRALAANFRRERGLALGLALSGTGLCAVLVPQFTVWIIERHGWRAAYVGLGLLPLLLSLPLAYIGFRPAAPARAMGPAVPSVLAQEWGMTLREALRTRRFWILLVSILAIYLAVSGIAPNLIPALTDAGLTPRRAATAQSIFGGSVVLGRLVVGFLVDRFWAPGVAAVSLSLPAVGCWILMGHPDFTAIALAAMMIGFAAGAELDLMSFLAATYFGVRHYAKIYAVLYGTLAVAGGIAPVLFAYVFDRTASYAVSFLLASGSFLFGALVLLALGRYPRSISVHG